MSRELIEGVETSIAGFVGDAIGPHGDGAVNVSSFAEFERAFGGLTHGLELGYAVAQYFANGGREAWVAAVPVGTRLDEGLPLLEAAGTIGLLCLPGEADVTVLRAALEYAERRRAFLLVDPADPEQDRVLATIDALGSSSAANGAAFYPSVRIPDPLAGGSLRTCASGGTVAGMYARNDVARGVWSAPAGPRAPLAGVAEVVVDLGELEISALTAAGLNCIRRLPDAGIVVWGARTLARALPGSEWKYVNVRRLALFLEESLDRGIQWAVFEPNDEQLWARLRAQCTAFLDGLFRAEALRGRTSEERRPSSLWSRR
jgi:phage tail sheath protein FI